MVRVCCMALLLRRHLNRVLLELVENLRSPSSRNAHAMCFHVAVESVLVELSVASAVLIHVRESPRIESPELEVLESTARSYPVVEDPSPPAPNLQGCTAEVEEMHEDEEGRKAGNL